jgi:hypothetical protein
VVAAWSRVAAATSSTSSFSTSRGHPPIRAGDPAFLGFTAGESWLKDRGPAKSLIESLLSSPLFAAIAIGRTGVGDFAPVTGAKAARLVATRGEVSARFHDREDNYELWIELDLRAARCEVRLNVSGGALAERGDRALGGRVLRVRAPPAAASEPPLPRGLGRHLHRSRLPRQRRELRQAGGARGAGHCATAAPANTSTTDGLLTVRWATSCDEAELRAGASGHAQWIADRIAPDIEDDFNELGDQREDRAYNSKPRGKLTLYDRESEVGYKAVVFPDGTFERTAWNDARKIAKAGKLADGATVTAVLYPDDEGTFWNPDPPGEWLTPPVRSTPAG